MRFLEKLSLINQQIHFSLSLSLFKFSFVIHTVHVCISGDENHLRFCKDLFLFTLKKKKKKSIYCFEQLFLFTLIESHSKNMA